MFRAFFLSVLLITAAIPSLAEDAVDQWNPTTLSDKTIEAVQKQTVVYHQCLDRQVAGFNAKDFDSRDASNWVLKQCENELNPIRDAFLKEGVPLEIANRYLLRKRHQAARQVLKYMMFTQSRQIPVDKAQPAE